MVARASLGVVVVGVMTAVVTGVVTGVVAAEPRPKPVDTKAFRDKLVVLEDADGGIYAVTNHKREEPQLFYGTGKVLHAQLLEGSRSFMGDVAWSLSIFAPRAGHPFMAYLERDKTGAYRKRCGELVVELTEVTGDKARRTLERSKFMSTSVIRRPYLLARDDHGSYYYVDVIRNEYGGNGHRLFVGRKGALKQLPLTDIVTDSAGELFTTRSGNLRLNIKRVTDQPDVHDAAWVRGERVRPLVWLDPYINQALIYRDLGIYKISNTVCGNL